MLTVAANVRTVPPALTAVAAVAAAPTVKLSNRRVPPENLADSESEAAGPACPGINKNSNRPGGPRPARAWLA